MAELTDETKKILGKVIHHKTTTDYELFELLARAVCQEIAELREAVEAIGDDR